MEKSSENIIIKIIVALGILVWAFWTLNTGLYVDENGLLTIYRGIYQGNQMFVDTCSVYQMAGIMTYPLFALYYQVLEPLIYPLGIGLVLYTRIAYLLCRGIISIYLYSTLRRSKFHSGAYLASLFYFINVVGWKNFSYKSICDFGIILLICFLLRYYSTKKDAYFVGMGLATCIAILAYPTMIVFPVAFCVVLLVQSVRGYSLIRPLILYIVTCLVIGITFLGYLQFNVGISKAFSMLKFLSEPGGGSDDPFLIHLLSILGCYVVFGCATYFGLVIDRFLGKIFNWTDFTEDLILSVGWFVALIAICVIRPDSISLSRFVYGLLVIFFLTVFLLLKKSQPEYIKIGSFQLNDITTRGQLISICAISFVVQLIWAFSTNQGIETSGIMSYYAAIAVILWIYLRRETARPLVLVLMLAVCFFGLIYVPNKNGGFYTIFDKMYYVEEGALKGIALTPDEYESNKICYELMSEYTSENDHLLVTFGTNSTAYLNSDAKLAIGNPYNRIHLNTILLDYWREKEENMADYVLIDRNCDKYETFVESETGIYINEEYSNVVAEQEGFILLSR